MTESSADQSDLFTVDAVADIVHELRAPLSAAKGFIDTILSQWDRLDDEQKRHMLIRASANAAELSILITQILDAARLDENRFAVDAESLGLKSQVTGLLEDLAPLLVDHQVHEDVPPGLKILADPEALRRVLTNLLTNAVKFSSPGSQVVISAIPDGQNIRISVQDEGRGMNEEEKTHAFDRFYQAPDASRMGMGIGLNIVKQLVEAMSGSVSVVSEVSEGTTFSVRLPSGS